MYQALVKMKITYFFILCGFTVIRADTKLGFRLIDPDKCVLVTQSDIVFEGDTVRADFFSATHIQNAICKVHEKPIPTPPVFQRRQDAFFLNVKNITREMSGLWTCHLESKGGESDCKVKVTVTEVTTIRFFIESEAKRCQSQLDGPVKSGKFRIQVAATFPLSSGSCYLHTNGTINRDNVFAILKAVQTYPLENMYQSEVKELSSDMSGSGKTLVCLVKFMQNNNIHNLTCELPMKSVSVAGAVQGRNLKDSDTKTGIIIGCVVGIIVVLVIVGQTIALVYFRKRAQLQERMDSLRNAAKPFERNDQARYSAPPRQRSPKRENADTDSHIYEMVGVNEMYNTGSHRSKITDIKDRPRLPLPGEAYEEPSAMNDTLPRPKQKLSSSPADAPPPRPAKKETPLLPRTLPKPTIQKDEPPTLPGSLRRPPKPVPKNGSVPKNMANDPAILELKNVLKKRVKSNIPQNLIPEKKVPPIPIKTPQPDPPKKPIGVIRPLSPPEPIQPTNSRTSSLKARLEAAFSGKQPQQQNARMPQTIQELATPDRMPQTIQELATPDRMPQTIQELAIPAETKPELATSVVRPQTKPVLPALPSRKAVAESGLPYRLLPPIESSTEDLNQDDDEEWTYEPLDKFNIYNV